MKAVIKFLKDNGFERVTNSNYVNDKCMVSLDGGFYSIRTKKEWNTIYSKGLSIYWLIGVLTYYNLIDRNYIS